VSPHGYGSMTRELLQLACGKVVVVLKGERGRGGGGERGRARVPVLVCLLCVSVDVRFSQG